MFRQAAENPQIGSSYEDDPASEELRIAEAVFSGTPPRPSLHQQDIFHDQRVFQSSK